jgi:hypothetical protein
MRDDTAVDDTVGAEGPPRPESDGGATSRTSKTTGRSAGRRGAKTTIGDDAAQQPTLPFAASADEPIGYVLTARARRKVAPETLPDLTVIPGKEIDDGVWPDPHDPRPARARALRRSGRTIDDVAVELGVGVDLVSTWCEDVTPRRRRKPPVVPRPTRELDPRIRHDARNRATGAIAGSAEQAAIGGLIAGIAVIAGSAVTVTPPEPAIAVPIIGWMRRHADAKEIRAVVAVGPGVARDLVAQDWARRLGLPIGAVAHVPWAEAPDPGAVRVTVRCVDPAVAAVVAGWRDALTESTSTDPTHVDQDAS